MGCGGPYPRYLQARKYQDVILPLTVLRRLDCVLAVTKEKVLRRQAQLKGKGLEDLDAQLRRASAFVFYRCTPPLPLEEIESDIRTIDCDIARMLAAIIGG